MQFSSVNDRSGALVVERLTKPVNIIIIAFAMVVKSDVKDNTSFKYCDMCPICGIKIFSVGPLYLLPHWDK